jgi:hypothetical protein
MIPANKMLHLGQVYIHTSLRYTRNIKSRALSYAYLITSLKVYVPN